MNKLFFQTCTRFYNGTKSTSFNDRLRTIIYNTLYAKEGSHYRYRFAYLHALDLELLETIYKGPRNLRKLQSTD